MGDTRTGSQTSVFPNFRSFDWNEVPWWIICCRVYDRKFAWRQVPAQISLEDIRKEQGKHPEPKIYPEEPQFVGDPSNYDDRVAHAQEHREWDRKVQELNREYQDEVLAWEAKGLELSQQWDLSPVPEVQGFDSRLPEEREWVPRRVFERESMQSEQARRIPIPARSWRRNYEGKWEQELARRWKWEPYTPKELARVLGEENCLYVPETLIVVVPGESFQTFRSQLNRQMLALVRCRWDPEAQDVVAVGRVPQTFDMPEVETAVSLTLADLGALPITTWPDVPDDLYLQMDDGGWKHGQHLPINLEQFDALESMISREEAIPKWYASPEYRAAVATNLCFADAMEQWGEACLWRPLLEPDSEDLGQPPRL